MRKIVSLAAAVLLGITSVSALAMPAPEVPRMTKEELKSLLDNPDVVILDVRTTPDYDSGSAKVKGALRMNMTVPSETWIDRYPKEKMYVFYCSWHDEATSAGLARMFIQKGYMKSYALKGGWREWEAAGYPTEPK